MVCEACFAAISICCVVLDSLEVEVDENTDELNIGKERGRFKLKSAMSSSARAYLVDDLLSPISLILLEEPGDGD